MGRGIPFGLENTIDFDYNQYTIQYPNMVMPTSQPAMPVPAVIRLAISADEMAELLGISRAHVWRLHSQGRIPGLFDWAGLSGGIGQQLSVGLPSALHRGAVGSDAQRK